VPRRRSERAIVAIVLEAYLNRASGGQADLLLQRGPEALDDGVVEAVARGSHRQRDAALAAAAAERDRGVLGDPRSE